MRQDIDKTAAVAFAIRMGHRVAMAHRFLETLCEEGILGQERRYPEVLTRLMREQPEEQD